MKYTRGLSVMSHVTAVAVTVRCFLPCQSQQSSAMLAKRSRQIVYRPDGTGSGKKR